MELILQILFIVIVFGSILFLAYAATKYIAGKSSMAMRGKYINVIETVSLGMDKRLHLVKVDKQFILIASTSKTVELLATVNLEDFDKTEEVKEPQVFDFKAFFDKYIHHYKSKKTDKAEGGEELKDNGQGDSFKTNLDKMRAITKKLEGQYLKDRDDAKDEK